MEVASLNLSASAVPPASYAQSGLVTVGFGKRAGARIIDFVIHAVVAVIAGFSVGILVVIVSAVTGSSAEPVLERMGNTTVWSRIVALLGFIVYSLLCEGLHGSTAGKYLLGLVVLRENGRPCTYTQAVARSFAFVIDGFFFGLVGYFAMKESALDQRRGDQWAGTVVVTRASAPPESLRGPGRFIGVFLLALFFDSILLAASALL